MGDSRGEPKDNATTVTRQGQIGASEGILVGPYRTLERLGFQHTADNPVGYVVAGMPEPVHEYRLTRERWQRQSSDASLDGRPITRST